MANEVNILVRENRDLLAKIEEWERGTKETDLAKADEAIVLLKNIAEQALVVREQVQNGTDAVYAVGCIADLAERALAAGPVTPTQPKVYGDGHSGTLTVTPAQLASDHVYKTVTVPPHPAGPEFCPWCGAPTGAYTTIELNGHMRSEGVCFKCAGVWAVELINCKTPPIYCLSCGASGDYRTYAAVDEEKP